MRSITVWMSRTKRTNGSSRRVDDNREARARRIMSEMSPAWPIGEPWQLPMPDGTLYDALARAADRRPHHPATAFYGAMLSYAELRHRVDAMAGFLQTRCGVKRGDRVLVALQNSPQYVIGNYAWMRADAVILPGNPLNRTSRLSNSAAHRHST